MRKRGDGGNEGNSRENKRKRKKYGRKGEMNGGKENNKLVGEKKREYRAVVGNNWHSVHRVTVT